MNWGFIKITRELAISQIWFGNHNWFLLWHSAWTFFSISTNSSLEINSFLIISWAILASYSLADVKLNPVNSRKLLPFRENPHNTEVDWHGGIRQGTGRRCTSCIYSYEISHILNISPGLPRFDILSRFKYRCKLMMPLKNRKYISNQAIWICIGVVGPCCLSVFAFSILAASATIEPGPQFHEGAW